jgi:hypothetical protein
LQRNHTCRRATYDARFATVGEHHKLVRHITADCARSASTALNLSPHRRKAVSYVLYISS